jgi:N-acetylglucosaminyldiphosphoundecaprenol N-acetyl-beta-D-mannosaminyltransferase
MALLAAAPRVRLLGCDFADASIDAVLADLAARNPAAPFTYLATPNADHLVRLARDPSLRPLYERAGVLLLDSRVVRRLAGLLGLASPSVVTGSDLTAALFERVIGADDRLTIIGGAPGQIATLIEKYGLRGVAHHNPPMGFDRDPTEVAACVDFMRAHPARFVFLAVGSPRQERLAHTLAGQGGGSGIGLCIGASIDFLTGQQARAPAWMQGAGLEWAHRLASDPSRLARRYLIDNPPILALLVRERLRQRAGGSSTA